MGAAAEAAENRKHTANDPKCAELGWRCVPLAVELTAIGVRKQEEPSLYWPHAWPLALSHFESQGDQ